MRYPPLRDRRDLCVAAVLLMLSLISLPTMHGTSEADAGVGMVAVLLVIVASVPLVVRPWWPAPVLLVTGGATAVYLGLQYPYGPILFSFAVAVYAVGRRLLLGSAAGYAVLALVALEIHVFTHPAALPPPEGLVAATAWVVVPFTIGVVRRLVLAANARERAEADRRLVDAERFRMAQEVHDVVGHGLAAIQMQADIALHLGDGRPGPATEALTAISRASEEALTELRVTLATTSPDEQAARMPTAGLANLDELRRRVEGAGVDVTVRVEGEARPLSASADLTAYRVLQEALTNVLKHAPHSHADVTLAYGTGRVELAVSNDCADARFTEGFGITGMRRRVERVDGTLSAGPVLRDHRPARFRVRATLPIEEDSDA